MESRTVHLRLVAFVVATIAASLVAGGSAGAAPPSRSVSPWTRPVPGRVVEAFDPPDSVYGAGHRGVDLATTPGAAVVAPGAGSVVFAGRIGESFHVSIDHGSGVVSSLSFLAGVAVRRSQRVARGQVIGSAGGTGPHHDGRVVHLGLRVNGRYVDPMRLFGAVDLAAVVRLAPVRHGLDRAGYSTPRSEARELAASLHIPTRLPGLEPPEEPAWWQRAWGDAWGGARTIGSIAGKPLSFVWSTYLVHTPIGAGIEDLRLAGSRLLDVVRARRECDDTPTPAIERGSRHLLFGVAGINSSTDRRTGRTFDLDTTALGYAPEDVRYFSYAADGGPYSPTDTHQDLMTQAVRMRDQLRAYARANPGREVDVVAHSQGGVVVDVFFASVYDPTDPSLPPLGTVVTLSSPHQGATTARVGAEVRSGSTGRTFLDAVSDASAGMIPPADQPSVRQLDPASDLMRGLRGRTVDPMLSVTSIGATDDFVVDSPATRLAGADHVTVNPAGANDHSGILTDRDALRAARRALERAPARCLGWAEAIRGAIEPVLIRRAELTAGSVAHDLLDPPLSPGGVPFPLPIGVAAPAVATR